MNPEVWIVDDDRSIRYVLAEALREEGLAVREFGDAGAVRAAMPIACSNCCSTWRATRAKPARAI